MEECTLTELEESGISIEERSDSDRCLLVSDKEDIKTIKQEITKDVLDKKENISKPVRLLIYMYIYISVLPGDSILLMTQREPDLAYCSRFTF